MIAGDFVITKQMVVKVLKDTEQIALDLRGNTLRDRAGRER
jgi:hypothetical protein